MSAINLSEKNSLNKDLFTDTEFNLSLRPINNDAREVYNKAGIVDASFNISEAIYNSIGSTRYNAFNVSGSVNSITLTSHNYFSHIPIVRYFHKQIFSFTPNGQNTGAVVINIDSVGIKSLKKSNLAELTGGDFQEKVYIEWDAGNDCFILINPINKILPNLTIIDASNSYLTYFNADGTVNSREFIGARTIPSSAESSSFSITFPFSFSTSCINVVATHGGSGGVGVEVSNLSTSGFTANVFQRNAVSGVSGSVYFRAIGY